VALARPYDGLASAWDSDASPVYQPLADSLVRAGPADLDGRTVLDVGSGTGGVARSMVERGARVVRADLSLAMLAHGGGRGRARTVADAVALPLGDAVFAAAAAGFLLNHVPPEPVLRELARVVRPGGAVLASTWSAIRPDPVKAAVDAVLGASGWVPPRWYEVMKAEVEPVSGHPRRLVAAAERAGLVEARATVTGVDLGLRDARSVVAYRLAMPHIAPWRAGLDRATDAELGHRLCCAVAPLVVGWRPSVIQLSARAPTRQR
jgi:ubiquinone/menaquinone biosynthesis C-methylase UbiE